MIEIVDIPSLIPPEVLAGLDQAVVTQVVLDLADAARAEWIRLAGEEFFTTRRDYIAGIQPVEFQDGTATITLVGLLPLLLEEGMEEVDLHNTLLGPNVPVVGPGGGRGKRRRKDGGYYRAIPFRHGTPGSGGASGQPMGRPYSGHEVVRDAKKLGQAVYKVAKQLPPSTSQPGSGTQWGGRLPEGMAPKLRPYHATDIFAGMVRLEKTYEKATQSSYMTFRTISVDAQGKGVGSSPWIRPATPGRRLAGRVSAFVTDLVPKAFEAYIQSLSGGPAT